MSSDVPDRPRKTLTLASPPAEPAGSPRKRSGGRARAVARAALISPQPENERQAPRSKRPSAPGRRPFGDSDRPSGQRSSPRPNRDGPSKSNRDGAPRPNRDGASRPSREGAPRSNRNDAPSMNRDSGPGYDRDKRNEPRPNRAPTRPSAPASGSTPSVQVATRHILAPEVERFTLFASCPQGLEDALAAEMQALSFDDAVPGRAGCSFTADWEGVQRANLYSRLATRVLVQVAQAPMHADDDVLELARATPWERWFGPEHTLRVDTSAIRSPVQSLQYCNLRVKDGICDRLRDLEGERPSIDTVRPDARVHLFLFENTATLYLDTSGESLFKRGWRLDKGEAPLRENLAAGILALADWDPEHALLDPFCGSGTLLIEAAWIALGIPPGIARPLGFERLRGHDSDAWAKVKEEAYSRIAPGLDVPIVGYDIDPEAIEFAKRNAERAWLTEDAIRFEVRDARKAERIAEKGWIVTNPPYGDRLENVEAELWQEWSGTLKHEFSGWNLHAITSDMAFPQQLRLKPKRRTPIYNGGIECRLFGFELVSASFRKE